MIRSFEVKLNAAHPELPLFEATAIVGSASTAFIHRVPASVGSWHITKVYVNAQYPDGSNVTIEAQVGAEGIWTATLPATETSGRVRSGFSILADGIDENGDPITQYILGIADFAVYTRDLKVQPGSRSWALKYFDVVPDPAKKGDVAKIDDAIKLYDGTQWVAFGSDVDLSNYYTKEETDALFDDYYTKQETDEAIDRLAAYYITYTAAGAAFPTRAALLNAATYYSGGVARVPTRNDYAVVLADESHSGAEYRYIYAVADGQTTGQWEAQYPIETNDYTALSRKPSINGVTLTGDKKSAEIGVASRADAKLYPVASGTPAFTEWTITADGLPVGTTVSQPSFNTYGADGGAWTVTIQNEQEGIQTALSVGGDEYTANDTYLVFRGAVSYYSASIVATRTCTNLTGYRLGRDVGVTAGMNNDKPLQPAGDYATKSDATLTVVYGGNGQKYSDWTCDPATIEDMGETHEFHVEKMSTGWRIMLDNAFFSPEFGNDDTTDYTYTGTSPIGEITVVATRVANTVSYQLGTQADKLLASEAALEALGGEVTGKVAKTGDTMTGGLTVPNLTVGSRDSQHQVGTGSTAEGENVSAVGMYCHAEGTNTYSSGYASHAEGFHTTATTNTGTHAEGCLTTALGEGSHAEGGNTETKNEYEHAEGRYNNSHRAAAYNWGGAGNTLSSTGFGSSENAKKNAVETMQDGKTFIYGLGGYDGTNPTATGVKDLATAVNGKAEAATNPTAGHIATLTAEGGIADGGIDVPTALRYALGETITATATLADRTMNKVEPLATNTADIKLSFPAATTGKARDFLVLIINPTGNTGAITFDPPAGAMIYGDGLTQTFAAGETWEVTITEVATKQFLCKALKVEGVQVPWTTKFEVTPYSSYLTTGIRSATAIDSTTPTIVDWGDGNTDSITGDISELTHTYSAAGTYVVTISDNISDFMLAGNNGGNWGNNQQIVTKILTISPNVTSLPSLALYGMQQLHYVYAGESGNLTLGGMAFYACGSYASDIGTFDFSGRTIATIPDQCFARCRKMATFAFPKGLTAINSSAFNMCFYDASTAGATLVIPEGVTTIGTNAFYNCTYLAEITIPSTVTSFSSAVFHTCPMLGTIRANMMSAVSGYNMFGGAAGEYTGENTAAAGTNRLYVRTGATGYDTGLWLDPLQSSSKCGFTKVEV